MKILIIADTIDEQYAGVYYYTKNLIDNLLKIDQRNEYVFLHLKQNLYFDDKKEVIVRGSRKIPGCMIIRKFLFIPFAIRKIKPDLVLEPAHVGPFSFLFKCQKIVVIHDLTPVLFPQFHLKLSGIVHKIFLPLIIKNSDGIIVPSQSTKDDLIRFYHPDKVIKITSEAAAAHFMPQTEAVIDSVKSKYNIDAPYLIAVGTIEPRKNLSLLIRVFRKLQRKGIKHKLVIVGRSGWYFDEIIGQIKELQGSIIFTEYVPEKDLPALYSGAELMVFPSLYEGFGLPPLEAMQCGCPLVCSNSSSLPEICGEAALLFDPHNETELEQALLKVISSRKLRNKMSAKGILQAARFSWRKCAADTIDFFEQVSESKD